LIKFFHQRVLDIEKDENFTLILSPQFGYSTNESILSVTYSAAKGIIAAGTDKGNVAMWKFMQNKSKFGEPEASWQLMHAKTLQQSPVTKIKVKILVKKNFNILSLIT
jgi:intraflagellar transport protein 140